MRAKVEINDGALGAALNRLVGIGENPRPALDVIGRLFKSKVQLGFATGTDPYGRPWKPLKFRQGQPLRKDGQLMGSVDYAIEGNSVVIGTNMEYAPLHQFGGTIEPKPGRFWKYSYQTIGRRGPRTVNVTRPALLVFPGPDGKLIFAKKVTIPARPFFPLDGLPQDWTDDAIAELRDVIGNAWRGG